MDRNCFFPSLLGGSQTAVGFQAKLNPVTGDLITPRDTNSPSRFHAGAGHRSKLLIRAEPAQTPVPCYNAFLLGAQSGNGRPQIWTFLGSAKSAFASGIGLDSRRRYLPYRQRNSARCRVAWAPVTNTYAPNGVADGGTDVLVARLHLSRHARCRWSISP